MIVYFVRHAQTDGNRQGRYQHADGPLSRQGEKQARCLAEYFRYLSVHKVVSSDMQRAKQTARAIVEGVQTEHEVYEGLGEITRPKEIVGKKYYAPSSLVYLLRSWWNRHDLYWRYSDEESLLEARERAKHMLQNIASVSPPSDKAVIVVTHGRFLNELLRDMAKKKVSFYKRLINRAKTRILFSSIKNAAVIICEHTPQKGWEIVDYDAHCS